MPLAPPAAVGGRSGDARVGPALLFALVIGVGMSLQVFINGRLSGTLGAAEFAGVVNNVGGLIPLVVVALLSGAVARSRPRFRLERPRWWHVAAGMNGALFIVATAAAAPKVGVALLTVALVSGQTAGSLLVDRLGLSPAGGRPFTLARVAGVVLAIVAVAIGALGTHGALHLPLLLVAVVAGAGVAVQQAAIGQVSRISGEPVVAGAVNFLVGTTTVLVGVVIVSGVEPPNGWGTPSAEWIGGLIGASIVILIARVVKVLGVLRLMLAVVAGQAAGGLVLDLVAPVAGREVTVATVIGVVLTLVAVTVSGSDAWRRRPPVPYAARARRESAAVAASDSSSST